jgi:hypothetical protein
MGICFWRSRLSLFERAGMRGVCAFSSVSLFIEVRDWRSLRNHVHKQTNFYRSSTLSPSLQHYDKWQMKSALTAFTGNEVGRICDPPLSVSQFEPFLLSITEVTIKPKCTFAPHTNLFDRHISSKFYFWKCYLNRKGSSSKSSWRANGPLFLTTNCHSQWNIYHSSSF